MVAFAPSRSIMAMIFAAIAAVALEDGLMLSPPRGWSSWYAYEAKVDQVDVRKYCLRVTCEQLLINKICLAVTRSANPFKDVIH